MLEMESYKTFTINGKTFFCYDESEGFTLEIDRRRYHIYEDGGTQIDVVNGDGREYFGKIAETWIGDEEEAAKFICNNIPSLIGNQQKMKWFCCPDYETKRSTFGWYFYQSISKLRNDDVELSPAPWVHAEDLAKRTSFFFTSRDIASREIQTEIEKLK
jgi:hypothetical protein